MSRVLLCLAATGAIGLLALDLHAAGRCGDEAAWVRAGCVR